MISIIVAEDDRDVRLSLIYMLRSDSEINIVGEADNGLHAVELAKALLPDLILMDVKLPKLDGLEASKRVKAFCAARGKDIIRISARGGFSFRSGCRSDGRE